MRALTVRPAALAIIVALVAGGCSSNLANATHDAGADHQVVDPPTGAGGAGGAPVTSRVPSEHRPVAVACAASTRSPPPPDGGARTCTTNADCAADGGPTAAFSTCLHGQCSFDQCLNDADCGATGVCACSSDYYGGNAAYHPNFCVQGNCRVDADCGAGGYCSPSRGYCGTFQGFYCHTPQDTCVDAKSDCGGAGPSCIYAPTSGTFVCGGGVCAG